MIRLIIFLALVGVLALGAGWIADQDGLVTLVWNGWRIQASVAVFAFALIAMAIAAIVLWSIASGFWRMPARLAARRRLRREAQGRAAIATGLIAIGTGDLAKARRQAQRAHRLAAGHSLTLLLEAQAAQLAGDHDAARRVFHAMAEREETRLLGLRGLFIEAQRTDQPLAAIAVAEEAVKIAPASGWAAQALLGFRCAAGDWQGAMEVLEGHYRAGQVDKPTYHRQKAVLLTAQAIADRESHRDRARQSVFAAVALAPDLVPAAAQASRFLAEDGNVRRAMKVAAFAWRANPHPDLADAYLHVRLGDSARERLGRAQTLAAMSPGHIEGALAVARAAIDASEHGKARAALVPFVAAPTQRVAMMMAEIERGEQGDAGRAREWTLRAVRASLDPAWTADGFVSDRWRPVSPVTGRLDAFRWMVPVAALPGTEYNLARESGASMSLQASEAAEERNAEATPASPSGPPEAGDVRQSVSLAEGERPPPPGPARAPSVPPRQVAGPANPRPLFRDRSDLSGPRPAVPPVIPAIHAPDDPGVDGPDGVDEMDVSTDDRQPGGWRGLVSRWTR